MKRKNYLATLSVALLALFGTAAAACGKVVDSSQSSSDSSVPEPLVTISQTSLELDLYESFQLTAEAVNTEEAIVWSTSNSSIVTVANGLVTAQQVGSATVTAEAGSASASCAVTVFNSGTAPVMVLNQEEVSVAKDGEFTVSVHTEWKGEPISEAISYTWELAEGEDARYASVTPSEDGSSAVIKGLEYGETAFYVSAEVRGAVLVKKVTVKVRNVDITFSVENLTPSAGSYIADVSLVETPEDSAAVTPEVSVYDKGTLVPDAAIAWTSEDETIAVVDENGTITALKEGTAKIVGTYENNTVTITVNAYRPQIALSQQAEIETAIGGTIEVEEPLLGEITGARLDGTDVYLSHDSDANSVTLDLNKLPQDLGKMGDGKQFVIDTDKAQYVMEVCVYTKILRTPEDVLKWNDWSYAADSANTYWSGYFVLGNDIDMEGYNYEGRFWYGNMYDMNTWTVLPQYAGLNFRDGKTGGFRGIFDGKGYNIDNLHITTWTGSFCGQIAQAGIIRNVSFTNVRLDGAAALISVGGNGTIENIYAHIVSAVTGNAGNLDKTGVFFAGDSMADSRVNNCFVDFGSIPAAGDKGFVGLGSFHLGYGILNGVYGVGIAPEQAILQISSIGGGDTYGGFVSYGDFLRQGIDLSGWDTDFWSVENGIPYPKNLPFPEGVIPEVTTEQYIGAGATVTLNGLSKYDVVTLSEETEKLGITVSGNLLTVPDGVEKGSLISFSVSSVFDPEKKIDLALSVVESKSLQLENTVDVEIEAGETFTVDLGGLASEVEGTLRGVTMDNKAFENISYSDGKLVIGSANLVGTWGEKTIVAEFRLEEDGVLSSMTLVSIPLDIVTMIINDEAELNRFLEVAKENAVGNSWAGIYKLGNDIVCEGTYSARSASGDTRGAMGVACGFNGTFDGCGYTIYNLHTVGDSGGFVAPLGEHGVLKNVSFVNAKNTGNGAFISSTGAGTVENVFIQIDITPNALSWNTGSSVIASDPYGVFRINKVIIEYINRLPESATTGYPLWNIHKGWGIVNGVYAVGVSKFYQSVGENLGETDVYDVFDTWEAFRAENIGFAAWDNDFWNIVNGLPVPARLAENAGTPEILNTELSVSANGAVKIDCADPYTTFTLDAAALEAGFTIAGRTVSVPADASGKSFTVTVTSAINGNTSSKTFHVIATQLVDVEEETAIDMTAAGNITFDLGKYQLAGTVVSATIGEESFSSVTFEGGVLTLDRGALSGKFGEEIIVLTLKSGEGGAEVLTTVNIPVLLVTKYIATSDDLVNLKNYTVSSNGALGGYFLQTADIDVGGKRIGFGGFSTQWDDSFCGVYDGGGYVIYNAVQGTNAGLFSSMVGGAVVRNVTFMNAQLTGEGGFIVTGIYDSTIENVVVYGSIAAGVSGANWAPASLVVSKAYENATVKNCLVVLKNHELTGANYAGMIIGDDQSNGTLTIEHCIAVNLKNAADKDGYVIPAIGANGSGGRLAEGTDTDTVHTFHGWAEYLAWAKGKDLSGYNGTAWEFLENTVPVTTADSLRKELAKLETGGIPATVPAGEASVIVLNNLGYYADYAFENSAEGISLGNGVITVTESFAGSVTLKLTALLDETGNVTIAIQAAETVSLSEISEIELNNTSAINRIDLSSAGALGTLQSLTLDGKTIAAALDGTTLTLSDATADMAMQWGEKTLVLTLALDGGGVKTINIPVLVITKVLRTADDVLAWNELSYAADSANTFWAGYFVLGNDVDMAGKNYEGKFWYGNMHDTNTWTPLPQYAGLNFRDGNSGGFRGVFDGRGFTIDKLNITTWTGSFCGQIAQAGIIRNVVFTNTTVAAGASLISVGGNGRIENIYVHISSIGAGSAVDSSGVFFGSDTMAAARVVNCFVKFDSAPEAGSAGFTGMGSYHLGYGILNNVYAVGIPAEQAIKVLSNAGGGDAYGAYATASEFAKAVTVSAENGWDMNFWTVGSDGLPLPKTLVSE